jgi:hypothetical protein
MAGPPQQSAGQALKNLDDTICALIRIGHHQVLVYPWRLFLRALKG